MTLTEIKAYFYNPKTILPKSLTIGCEHIPNVEATIRHLIMVLEANTGNRGYLPYFEQLKEIYKNIKK